MTWVVTGGAGYIGAHVVRALSDEGLSVAVVDDLSTGHAHVVPARVPFLEADILETDRLAEFLRDHDATGVIHVAGYKFAGESVRMPLHTYRVNVQGTMSVLEAMDRAGIRRLVFSSSAAVYGTPHDDRVTEATPTAPESPYGESKLIGEWLLADQGRAMGLRHTSLRYFNVVGSADPALSDTSPHNLFPLVFRALDRGERPRLFGADHPTPDGTCVRDYVHVADVARAHVTAARALAEGRALAPVYNLGSGAGTSVRQIMEAVGRVTGRDVDPVVEPRRPGDPARIVADGSLAARDLGWENRHTVENMVRSAWEARRPPETR
ncbi:UDP-glucose 4-epimerase GalE [Micrococcus endophyticus]|uniref:UDP-glucose 4-epimerase n=1 Tax=Micrococcus endophyticus TaxID=455343 RepID=A0A7W9N091_9MICC|nr:UDP-glucose 4-epimerase GalE [Micrococcus endophyticus]MBB5848790.1 UDP-glucose 4-epimerase [Micrococcus endophyticus]